MSLERGRVPTPNFAKQSSPLHLGLILDGNGRWAARRGMPRSQGHSAGAKVLRGIVEAAPGLGIRWLTVYAFSSDNWQRPAEEVGLLMRLLWRYLTGEAERCRRQGVAIEVVGRRDRLDRGLREAIERAERATRGGERLALRVAVDYSGRDAIRRAAEVAARLGRTELSQDELGELIARVDHASPVPPLDLLIRTGGEQRLSDFLLWESAYAELFFLETPWPEFAPTDLAAVVAQFLTRERRFGRVGPRAEPEAPPRRGDLRVV
ncbi:MAG: polyprenyl diphosphate synthase [Gemmatimonadales bacterium]